MESNPKKSDEELARAACDLIMKDLIGKRDACLKAGVKSRNVPKLLEAFEEPFARAEAQRNAQLVKRMLAPDEKYWARNLELLRSYSPEQYCKRERIDHANAEGKPFVAVIEHPDRTPDS